jgi:hypothetical protein
MSTAARDWSSDSVGSFAWGSCAWIPRCYSAPFPDGVQCLPQDRILGVLQTRRLRYGPDALAVAVALEPDIVRKAEAHYVQVELAARHTRGHSTLDGSTTPYVPHRTPSTVHTPQSAHLVSAPRRGSAQSGVAEGPCVRCVRTSRHPAASGWRLSLCCASSP